MATSVRESMQGLLNSKREEVNAIPQDLGTISPLVNIENIDNLKGLIDVLPSNFKELLNLVRSTSNSKDNEKFDDKKYFAAHNLMFEGISITGSQQQLLAEILTSAIEYINVAKEKAVTQEEIESLSVRLSQSIIDNETVEQFFGILNIQDIKEKIDYLRLVVLENDSFKTKEQEISVAPTLDDDNIKEEIEDSATKDYHYDLNNIAITDIKESETKKEENAELQHDHGNIVHTINIGDPENQIGDNAKLEENYNNIVHTTNNQEIGTQIDEKNELQHITYESHIDDIIENPGIQNQNDAGSENDFADIVYTTYIENDGELQDFSLLLIENGYNTNSLSSEMCDYISKFTNMDNSTEVLKTIPNYNLEYIKNNPNMLFNHIMFTTAENIENVIDVFRFKDTSLSHLDLYPGVLISEDINLDEFPGINEIRGFKPINGKYETFLENVTTNGKFDLTRDAFRLIHRQSQLNLGPSKSKVA